MNAKTFVGDVGENLRRIDPRCRNCGFYSGPREGSGKCERFRDTVLPTFVCREHVESDSARTAREGVAT